MNVPKNIVLKKLILLYLFIIIPLVLIISVSLITSTERLQTETIKSINDKCKLFSESLDNEFYMISESASSITTHSKVQKLSLVSQLMSNYDKVQAVLQMREYITGVKGYSNLVSNIKVYIPSVLKVYNTEGYKGGSYQTITPEDYQDLVTLKRSSSTPIFYHNNQLSMIILSSIKNPSNIVKVELSGKQLQARLNSQKMYNDSCYLFSFTDSSYETDNFSDSSFIDVIKNADYSNGYVKITFDKVEYQSFQSYLSYADAYYYQIIPYDTFLEPYWLSSLYTILFIVFIVVCVLVFLFGTIRLIHLPLTHLVHAFQAVEKGNLNIRIHESEKSEFSYLFQGFNDMTMHLENVIDEVYRKDLLLQKAEFKQLQAQINPHFLYNSFFMLQRMIQNRMNEEAIQVSKELGIYFKYITRNNSDYELFKDEYRHAMIYSKIQSMRFEERIRIEFGDLPAGFENLQVPRLILQPIIENAFNYGLENKAKDGLLRVQFFTMESGIEIIIEDNGEELSDEMLNQINNNIEASRNIHNSKEMTGILNIFRRIQIFYRNSSTLTVSRSELGGMKVTIFLYERDGEDNA